MKDLTIDGYGADGTVRKDRKDKECYNVVIMIPFTFKETAQKVLEELTKGRLILTPK